MITINIWATPCIDFILDQRTKHVCKIQMPLMATNINDTSDLWGPQTWRYIPSLITVSSFRLWILHLSVSRNEWQTGESNTVFYSQWFFFFCVIRKKNCFHEYTCKTLPLFLLHAFIHNRTINGFHAKIKTPPNGTWYMNGESKTPLTKDGWQY